MSASVCKLVLVHEDAAVKRTTTSYLSYSLELLLLQFRQLKITSALVPNAFS